MPNTLDIMLGKINYLHHTVDEALAPKVKPNEIDHIIRVKIDLRHIKGDGHEIDINVEQGFVKIGTNDRILTIESISKFKVIPYDKEFFKKPATTQLIAAIADMAEKACDHNRGMFVIIREDHGMPDALPMPIPKSKLRSLIFDDVNRQLLS